MQSIGLVVPVAGALLALIMTTPTPTQLLGFERTTRDRNSEKQWSTFDLLMLCFFLLCVMFWWSALFKSKSWSVDSWSSGEISIKVSNCKQKQIKNGPSSTFSFSVKIPNNALWVWSYQWRWSPSHYKYQSHYIFSIGLPRIWHSIP